MYIFRHGNQKRCNTASIQYLFKRFILIQERDNYSVFLFNLTENDKINIAVSNNYDNPIYTFSQQKIYITNIDDVIDI